ncbi:hypothetical protein [Candidatus Leptofilum sp.]|uniref:hypothetical protein n=1 Tax=Candidatus Leptofilum sp. TaxID=3241576 RepID=UPI003B597C52
MTVAQRLILTLLPRPWATAVVQESRQWHMQCRCGHTLSVWDVGGIRFKAKGTPRRLWHCSECGQRTWHRLVKQEKRRSR